MEPDKVYRIDPEEVVVDGERIRKKFERGSLVSLELSIQKYGQLQPGVCTRGDGERINLVAGERRLRACKSLGIPYRYSLREDLTDPLLLKEIELEENLQREDLSWLEEVKAKMELHEIKQQRDTRHRMQDTADHLKESKGLVSQDIKLALWAADIPEVANARNKTEAKKIIKRLEEGVERSDALEEALAKSEAPTADTSEGSTDVDATEVGEATPDVLSDTERRVRYYDRLVKHNSFEREAPQLVDESFDIVLFDPPWGVGFDKVRLGTGSTKDYPDDVRKFFRDFPKWIRLIHDKMKADSHLYLFFGIVHHAYVYDILETAGFTVNRMPIFWHKKGAHRTRNPEVWPGRCYEAIAYARKGSKPLAQYGQPDIVMTGMPTPTMKKSHPSAKHPDIYFNLIERSAQPGDRLLDPMCGSGMMGVACEQLRPKLALEWTMIERDQDFRELAVFNCVRGYQAIIGEKEAKLEPHHAYDELADKLASKRTVHTDFHGLKPGSNDWIQYWKDHPEEQDDMLEWKAKGGKV